LLTDVTIVNKVAAVIDDPRPVRIRDRVDTPSPATAPDEEIAEFATAAHYSGGRADAAVESGRLRVDG
jgi:hypothetical protein